MKNIIFYLSLLVSTLVIFTSAAEQETPSFNDAELAQMLAPIALYPDSLLTHILIASTYPIEIIEAHRWLKKNANLNVNQKSELLEGVDWDASVKALIQFERVLGRLSEDLRWTQNLGDAFLQDEPRLLLSIQTLRKQAKRAGSLNKMDNMAIDYDGNNISILSREKDVVYVPYYDSRMVYGSWFWSAYPPVYWHPYQRAYVSHYRPFYWNTGIHITFNYFFSAFHWHNRHVVIVTPYRDHYRHYYQRPRRLIAHGGYAKRWSHQPSHRKGVAYRTKRTSEKYYSKRHHTHKQLKTSQRHFKQRLDTSKYATGKEKQRVKYDKKQPRPDTKQLASHHKSKSTSTYKGKQNNRRSEQTRPQQSNSTKRERSSVRQQHRVNKPSHHKHASTERYHLNTMKERR
jgi:hypothetical protein